MLYDTICFMNDVSYKIIFVDIDWTILDHKKGDWDYDSINVLKALQARNILVYLNTARPFDSIMHTGLFDVFTPDGIVCTNGGVVFIGDKLLYANIIPEDIVNTIEKMANRHHLVLEISAHKERHFTAKPNIYVHRYFSVFHEVFSEVKKYQNKDVSAVLLFAPEKYDERIIKELPKEIKYIRFDSHGVDLIYYRNTKGEAVKKVLNYLGFAKENAIAAGDDLSDISMFKEAGLSIALGNGKEETKNAANIVAKDISEHGLGEILKEIFHI